MALYICSLLADLGVSQNDAVLLYKDNAGAFLMADAEKPTPRTSHIDIRHFVLLDWVERDLIQLEHISTALNTADILKKSTLRIIFHQHNDVLMGKISPRLFAQVQACFMYDVQ